MAEITRVVVNGRELRCQHCGHRRFAHDSATLDRRGFSALFHVESALIYICARCGYAHFFMPVPETTEPADATTGEGSLRLEDDPDAPRQPERLPDDACLACGSIIAGDADRCPVCGWTWEDRNPGPAADSVPGQIQRDERIQRGAGDRTRGGEPRE